MIVQIVKNATVMPTDGNGASAAAREAGNLTAVDASSATCSGGAAAAVAGDIIITNTGHWAEVTGPAVATVLPVTEWKKWGVSRSYTNTGIIDPIPATGTYRIFPATILQCARRGVRIKKASFEGIAGATLTINDILAATPGNVVLTLPATTAGHQHVDLGEGELVKGPFTVVCSNHDVVGAIEFQYEGG